MSLSRLRHTRKRWAPGFLALMLLAWSAVLADPCVLQLPAFAQASNESPSELSQRRPGTHLHAKANAHDAESVAHDHSACDHALEHSGESVLVQQADQGRSISLAFVVIALVLPIPVREPITRLALDHESRSPPLPVYLDTARLRI